MKRFAFILAALMISIMPVAAADNFSGCFTRIYDREHLGKHPEQLVKLIHLQVNKNRSEAPFSFVVFVAVRGSKTLAKFDGTCVLKGPGLECEATGDHGPIAAFFLTRKNNNMMLYLNYFSMWQGLHITKGLDDEVFRLDPGDCGKWRYNPSMHDKPSVTAAPAGAEPDLNHLLVEMLKHGAVVQCGPATISVTPDKKLQVTGLPYGNHPLTTKDGEIYLDGHLCKPHCAAPAERRC